MLYSLGQTFSINVYVSSKGSSELPSRMFFVVKFARSLTALCAALPEKSDVRYPFASGAGSDVKALIHAAKDFVGSLYWP